MNYSFMTFSCPEASLAEALEMAERFGYDGIEPRISAGHGHGIELGIDAYIPRSYIPSDRQRMEIYRRLVHCHQLEELNQLRADLIDAFGPLPREVDLLLDTGEVRILGARAGIESIVLMPPDIIFRISDYKSCEGIFAGSTGTVRVVDEHTVHWRPPRAYLEMPTLMSIMLKRLRTGVQKR